jgi:hypothetical protein
MDDDELPPILTGKHYDAPSAFTPRIAARREASDGPCGEIGTSDRQLFIARSDDDRMSVLWPCSAYRQQGPSWQ